MPVIWRTPPGPQATSRHAGSRPTGEWIGRYIRARHPHREESVFDFAVMSHLHGDHINAIAEVAGLVPIRKILDRAIAELEVENTFTIDKRGRDYFKIGRLWIELEMADRQKWSSQINTTVFTQPPDWPYAEGLRVPFSQPITVPLRWRTPADRVIVKG